VQTFCGQEGFHFSDADTELFVKNLTIFLETSGVSARTRGRSGLFEAVRTLCGQTGGVNFL